MDGCRRPMGSYDGNNIKVTIVLPKSKHPHNITKSVKREDLYESEWVKTVQDLVEKEDSNISFAEEKLTVYMRTPWKLGGHRWYSSRRAPLIRPRKENLTKAPEFLIASSKVGRQQRRGCCYSKGVTVRLPLHPGDDRHRRRSPCPTIVSFPRRVSNGCQRAMGSYAER
eukprot:GHVU01003158.1.p1 GENE.GHVU01003158.1~~GHVU01003158.1.p1  ORF type:complete len:169 (+),score=0.87 GHVU01003158.1:141-647(+)